MLRAAIVVSSITSPVWPALFVRNGFTIVDRGDIIALLTPAASWWLPGRPRRLPRSRSRTRAASCASCCPRSCRRLSRTQLGAGSLDERSRVPDTRVNSRRKSTRARRLAVADEFEVAGSNDSALFTLTVRRGEGMALLAMNWKDEMPPDDFVGFGIEYQEPGGTK